MKKVIYARDAILGASYYSPQGLISIIVENKNSVGVVVSYTHPDYGLRKVTMPPAHLLIEGRP